MANVFFVTPEAIYRGILSLKTATGQPVRLVDALRSPQRVGQAAFGATPSLELTGATRESRFGGERHEVPGGSVVLRPVSILAAADEGLVERDVSKMAYEQRGGDRSQATTRVRLYLEGRLVVEASVSGGLRSLDVLRGDTYVACTDVRILPAKKGGKVKSLPFLAVNTARIEGVSILSGDGTQGQDSSR